MFFTKCIIVLAIIFQIQAKPKIVHQFSITAGKNKTDTLISPRDFYVTDEELYVVDRTHKGIKIFDLAGNYLSNLSLDEEYLGITGIIINKDGNILACNPFKHAIAEFDFKGKFLDYLMLKDVSAGEKLHPIRLYFNAKNNFCIVDSALKRIILLNDKNEFLFEIKGENEKSNFLGVADMAFDSNGDIYILDSLQGKIFIFDSNGKFLRKFGKKGAGKGLLSAPIGIAVSKKGFIFISDTTRHTISIYDKEGEFVSEFGGFGEKEGFFNFPSYIFIDKKDNLYIADTQNNRLQVFQIN